MCDSITSVRSFSRLNSRVEFPRSAHLLANARSPLSFHAEVMDILTLLGIQNSMTRVLLLLCLGYFSYENFFLSRTPHPVDTEAIN